MIKRIICGALLCLILSTSVFATGSGVYGGDGEITMYDIRAAWEENGYPEYVSYAVRDGRGAFPKTEGDYTVAEKTDQVVIDGQLAEEYGDSFTAERWEIGVIEGYEAELISLLEKNLSNICVVNIVSCEHNREEIVSVYNEVLKSFCRRPSFDSVKIQGDQVVLRVSALTRGIYEKTLTKKYGGIVAVLPPRGNHESFSQYDENGNIVGEGSSNFIFETWLCASAVSLISILAVFGVLFVVRKIKK